MHAVATRRRGQRMQRDASGGLAGGRHDLDLERRVLDGDARSVTRMRRLRDAARVNDDLGDLRGVRNARRELEGEDMLSRDERPRPCLRLHFHFLLGCVGKRRCRLRERESRRGCDDDRQKDAGSYHHWLREFSRRCRARAPCRGACSRSRWLSRGRTSARSRRSSAWNRRRRTPRDVCLP